MILFKHEIKLNLKLIIIWSACVGFSCFGCILLFGGLKESMGEMADAYAQMGTFSSALGLLRHGGGPDLCHWRRDVCRNGGRMYVIKRGGRTYLGIFKHASFGQRIYCMLEILISSGDDSVFQYFMCGMGSCGFCTGRGNAAGKKPGAFPRSTALDAA